MRSPVAGNLLFVLPFCLLTLSGCSDRNDVVSDKESSQQKAEAMSTQKSANFVLTNGRIYTVNEDQPWAQAVAVDGNKIVYVGDNDGAKAFVGAGTESLDLEGRLVLPGFVESHIHLMLGAATSSGLTLTMTDSISDVRRKLKEYADANREKKTLFGASYNAFLFDAKGPNKELLDKVVPDRPVLLMDHTIHSVWVNSKALEVAGITKETKDPPGANTSAMKTAKLPDGSRVALPIYLSSSPSRRSPPTRSNRHSLGCLMDLRNLDSRRQWTWETRSSPRLDSRRSSISMRRTSFRYG